MNCFRYRSLILGAVVTAITMSAAANDSKDEAVKKDQQLIQGTWRVVTVEVDGNKGNEEDIKKITVINGSDGTWILRNDGNQITKGTSTIDPTKNPKTIDFIPTEGDDQGKQFLGIYELGENTRKLCFAPAGKERPTEFTSTSGSERILVTLEREKAK